MKPMTKEKWDKIIDETLREIASSTAYLGSKKGAREIIEQFKEYEYDFATKQTLRSHLNFCLRDKNFSVRQLDAIVTLCEKTKDPEMLEYVVDGLLSISKTWCNTKAQVKKKEYAEERLKVMGEKAVHAALRLLKKLKLSRNTVWDKFVEFLARNGTLRVARELIEFVKDGGDEVYCTVVGDAMMDNKMEAGVEDLLIDLFDNPGPHNHGRYWKILMKMAMRVLSEWKCEKAREKIFEAFTTWGEEDPDVIIAIGNIGETRAIPALAKIKIEDEEFSAAIMALGAIGTPEAVNALVGYLIGPDGCIRFEQGHIWTLNPEMAGDILTQLAKIPGGFTDGLVHLMSKKRFGINLTPRVEGRLREIKGQERIESAYQTLLLEIMETTRKGEISYDACQLLTAEMRKHLSKENGTVREEERPVEFDFKKTVFHRMPLADRAEMCTIRSALRIGGGSG